MAFVDKDEWGDPMVNLTLAVGPGKANLKDDVAAVQIMLQMHFITVSGNPKLATSAYLDIGELGVFDLNTGLWIRDFQAKFLRRGKPQGWAEPALDKKKSHKAIWYLNNRLYQLLSLIPGETRRVVGYLSAFRSWGRPSKRSQSRRSSGATER